MVNWLPWETRKSQKDMNTPLLGQENSPDSVAFGYEAALGEKPVVNIESKRAQFRLVVDEAIQDDYSVVSMHPETMQKLEISSRDTLLIESKKTRNTYTACTVMADETCPEQTIRMSKVVRLNLEVFLSDIVSVRQCPDVKHGQRVHVLPVSDTVQGLPENLLEACLKPYFADAYRPVRAGDRFLVRCGMNRVEFKIIETNPPEYCIVAPNTEIFCKGEPESECARLDIEGYDDVGGLREQKALIRELLEVRFRHPQISKIIDDKPEKYILLCGPPGSGKTLLARAVANETSLHWCNIIAHKIMSQKPEKRVEYIREQLWAAHKYSNNSNGTIIFVEDVDLLSQRAIASCLLLFMNYTWKTRKDVVIMGTTTEPNNIDPALRRAFDMEINIGVPDEVGRLEILRIHTRNKKLSNDVDLEKIAKDTDGYVAADLTALCAGATRQCTRENLGILVLEDESLDVEALNSLTITGQHFKTSLARINSS